MNGSAAVPARLPASATRTPQELAGGSGSNFLVSFLFLGRARRSGLTAIYAFCRAVDDAVDEAPGPAEAEADLAFWRAELAAAFAGRPTTPVGRALLTTAARFGLRPEPLEAVLDGMAMDVRPAGCVDLTALEEYCKKVASAVGLACLPVFGVSSAVAERYALRLGLALQLTNILRDLREDALTGRCYAPQAWLGELGVQAEWLRGDGPESVYADGGPVARLCARLHGVAAERFEQARTALRQLPRSDRRRLVPARVMAAVYGELLQQLRSRGGDLRQPRVRLHRLHKLWLGMRTALSGLIA